MTIQTFGEKHTIVYRGMPDYMFPCDNYEVQERERRATQSVLIKLEDEYYNSLSWRSLTASDFKYLIDSKESGALLGVIRNKGKLSSSMRRDVEMLIVKRAECYKFNEYALASTSFHVLLDALDDFVNIPDDQPYSAGHILRILKVYFPWDDPLYLQSLSERDELLKRRTTFRGKPLNDFFDRRDEFLDIISEINITKLLSQMDGDLIDNLVLIDLIRYVIHSGFKLKEEYYEAFYKYVKTVEPNKVWRFEEILLGSKFTPQLIIDHITDRRSAAINAREQKESADTIGWYLTFAFIAVMIIAAIPFYSISSIAFFIFLCIFPPGGILTYHVAVFIAETFSALVLPVVRRIHL